MRQKKKNRAARVTVQSNLHPSKRFAIHAEGHTKRRFSLDRSINPLVLVISRSIDTAGKANTFFQPRFSCCRCFFCISTSFVVLCRSPHAGTFRAAEFRDSPAGNANSPKHKARRTNGSRSFISRSPLAFRWRKIGTHPAITLLIGPIRKLRESHRARHGKVTI